MQSIVSRASETGLHPDDASLTAEIRPEEIPEVMNGYGLNMPESFVTVAT